MRIESIQLQNFRGFSNLKVEFPIDQNLIGFIGENGSGKTSLLDAMSMMLQDLLHQKHTQGRINWSNPNNVRTYSNLGEIQLKLKDPKETYEFKQEFQGEHLRIISLERMELEMGRKLTDEELLDYYHDQVKTFFIKKDYKKSLELALKLETILLEPSNYNFEKLHITYENIAYIYSELKDYKKEQEYLHKNLKIKQDNKSTPNITTIKIFLKLSNSYYNSIDFKNAIEYWNKVLQSIDYVSKNNEISSLKTITYNNIGCMYKNSKDFKLAISNFIESLKLASINKDIESIFIAHSELADCYCQTGQLNLMYNHLLEFSKSLELPLISPLILKFCRVNFSILEKGINYEKNNKNKEKYAKLQQILKDKINLLGKQFIEEPELRRKSNPNDLKKLDEYLSLEIPLILHYTARPASAESFKTAMPIAFQIPMTTDFALVADWFIEHENSENAKRLRVDNAYRSPELELIRYVLKEGLNLLNAGKDAKFSDLRTEMDETVSDGQVRSWLSINKNGLRLRVDQLSDGEKRVLVLFFDIARRLITLGKQNQDTDYRNGRGIVLIDELEQHLHPKWQRSVLPTLTALFPNLQFIVSTHSPQVLSLLPNGCTFELDNWKVYPKNTYGRDNEWILSEIMEDVNRPVHIQKELDDYFELIRIGELEKAKIKRADLENRIGADEPEFLKADILIRRKTKSNLANENN